MPARRRPPPVDTPFDTPLDTPASAPHMPAQPQAQPGVESNAVPAVPDGCAANQADSAYVDGPVLPQSDKVVLILDLVESVRLMALDEGGVVARWHGFIQKVAKLVPRYQGRIVKSLGDGLLAAFNRSRDAVQVAIALHKIIQTANQGREPAQHMFLRIGINACDVYVDENDIYGAGVNLAARLASLAGPGETIASASVRDQLTDGLDADVEDMGECFVKHLDDPVRAYRIGPAGPRPVLQPEKDYNTPLQPTIAVIPFTSRSSEPEHFAIGELIADGVIGQLSRTRELKVISRLSTSVFRGRLAHLPNTQKYLGANYVLSGSYTHTGSQGMLVVVLELLDVQAGSVMFADRFHAQLGDLLEPKSELLFTIANAVHTHVVKAQIDLVFQQPAVTLKSYSLLLGGIGLMHRSVAQDFHHSRLVLEALVERSNTNFIAHAWLAKWFVLNVTRGLSQNPRAEAAVALRHARMAQAAEGVRSLAMAMEGFVQIHLVKDFDAGISLLDAAIDLNPNESLAWLFSGVARTFLGQTEQAFEAGETALALSPMDPVLYYYEALAASGALAAERYARAAQLCRQSIRRNRTHLHTHRALVTALWQAGDLSGAQRAATDLVRQFPGYTVQKFVDASTSGHTKFGQAMKAALIHAGVPMN